MIYYTPYTLWLRLRALSHVVLLCSVLACNDSAVPSDAAARAATGAAREREGWMPPTASKATTTAAGSAAAAPSQPAKAGASARSTGTAMSALGSAGAAASSGSAGAAAGSGAAGASAGASGAAGAAGHSAAGASASSDSKAFASGFAELFLDVACDSSTRAPLEQGATCNHPPNKQRIEKMLSFGGEAGKNYKLTLRVRGIWEPTNVTGGMRPYDKVPFTIGGNVASGAGSSSDSINYQQYFIEVAEPKQTYWLNDYQYVAHDIHKEDYEASLTVGGGAKIKVVMNDGNEREIANFPKEMFTDIPPYDKMPSLGQSLRFDVVSVEAAAAP